MKPETIEDLTGNLVKAASRVLEMFRNGNHPTETQLRLLDGALFPFEGEKLCGHKIVEECECDQLRGTQ